MGNEIRSLTLVLTERCNLRCAYCYLAAQSQGADMSEGTMAAALNYATEACHIQLSGGEPCLVPTTVTTVIDKVRQHSDRHRISLQTNATRLTPELVTSFKANNVQIGVSLDGPAEIHQQLRGGFDDTIKGLKMLQQQDVPFTVTCVVSAINVMHLERLALLLAAFPNCLGLGLDLLVHKGRADHDQVPPASATQLTSGMTKLARTLSFINGSRRTKLRLRELDLLERGGRERFCHAACGTSLAVTPTGAIYPCSQSIGLQELSLGTLAAPDFSHQPLRESRLTDPDCSSCPLNGRCPGDCPNRIHVNQEAATNICALYRALAATTGR